MCTDEKENEVSQTLGKSEDSPLLPNTHDAVKPVLKVHLLLSLKLCPEQPLAPGLCGRSELLRPQSSRFSQATDRG